MSFDAFIWACALDVAVPKPGNVSLASPGHGMTAVQFLVSAHAAAAPLCRPGTAVGRRIEAAVQASRAAAACNTNLGIVLLCAPIAAAWERCRIPAAGAGVPPDELRAELTRVLDRLDVDDARAAYRGIAEANPGGLGRAAEQDVAQEPTIGLREAMALAAARDSIARQYATGFAELFEFGWPALREGLDQAPAGDLQRAVLATFLGWLARWPDSHIVRKHGALVGQSVTGQAAALRDHWQAAGMPTAPPALSSWDTQLKALGINPGTSADLTVATLFIAACLDPSLLTRSTTGAVVA